MNDIDDRMSARGAQEVENQLKGTGDVKRIWFLRRKDRRTSRDVWVTDTSAGRHRQPGEYQGTQRNVREVAQLAEDRKTEEYSEQKSEKRTDGCGSQGNGQL